MFINTPTWKPYVATIRHSQIYAKLYPSSLQHKWPITKQDGCKRVRGPHRQQGDVKLPSFLNGNAPRGEKEEGTNTKSVHIKDHLP